MIYFIQDTGSTYIKIGYTASVAESRQKAGETWCPFGLVVLVTMPGDKRIEAELHVRFAAARINPDREWFRPTSDLLRFIMEQSEQAAFLRGVSHARQVSALTTPASSLNVDMRRKELSLLSIQASICHRCPDLVSSRKQTVFGSGPVNAELCFIGEAPGDADDRLGNLFVGPGGQLLERIFVACGLERSAVYLTSICKCRSRGCRLPTQQEANNCHEFLDAELDLVRPKAICALGNCAARNLLDTDKDISDLRGRWFEYQGFPVLCTYHPASLLPGRKHEDKKEVVCQDMKTLLKRTGRMPA